MKNLVSWLGSGATPVPIDQAIARAKVCEHCPKNVEPNWWNRAKGAIADWIRDTIETKKNLCMILPNEERLSMCDCCGCCIRLKVHVPLEYARRNAGDLEKFPSWCWLVSEK